MNLQHQKTFDNILTQLALFLDDNPDWDGDFNIKLQEITDKYYPCSFKTTACCIGISCKKCKEDEWIEYVLKLKKLKETIKAFSQRV